MNNRINTSATEEPGTGFLIVYTSSCFRTLNAIHAISYRAIAYFKLFRRPAPLDETILQISTYTGLISRIDEVFPSMGK